MNRSLLMLGLMTLGLAVTAAERQPDDRSIVGVWKVVEIANDQWTPDTDPASRMLMPNQDPLPSQIIFTKSHYSFIWIPGREALRAFATPWQATDAEKLRRFDEVTVNTGTYSIEGARILIHPVVARVPEFMGGTMIYGYRWSGDRLVLTFLDEKTFDGVPAPWVENASGVMHLTLERVED